MTREWLTVAEAVVYLDVSERQVRRLINSRTIPSYRPFERKTLIAKTDLDEFIRSARVCDNIASNS